MCGCRVWRLNDKRNKKLKTFSNTSWQINGLTMNGNWYPHKYNKRLLVILYYVIFDVYLRKKTLLLQSQLTYENKFIQISTELGINQRLKNTKGKQKNKLNNLIKIILKG